MRNKIAFKPHETRGKEIIKILEEMGGVNKYNLDGSKGIIAIDYSSNKSITNDWDYCGLLLNGWEIYNLEGYEKLKKTSHDFAVDILTKKKDCYFDDIDIEIVAEAYIAGHKDIDDNGHAVENYDTFKYGAKWAFDTIFNWLKDNMDTRKTIVKDMLGNDMCLEYLTADFKSVDELIGNFKYDKLVTEE